MDTASYYCWYCYRRNPRPDGTCATCAQPVAPPAGTSRDQPGPAGTSRAEIELWALSHPRRDRRFTAIGWLGRHHETRAVRPLRHLAADPDPSLAAAATHSLTALNHPDLGPDPDPALLDSAGPDRAGPRPRGRPEMAREPDFYDLIATLPLAPHPSGELDTACRDLAGWLGVDGAGITLTVPGHLRLALGASNQQAGELEQTQLTVGEGPCTQAARTGRVVRTDRVVRVVEVPDLTGTPPPGGRSWPSTCPG